MLCPQLPEVPACAGLAQRAFNPQRALLMSSDEGAAALLLGALLLLFRLFLQVCSFQPAQGARA